MKTIRYTLKDGIASVVFDDPSASVNIMSQAWQDDLSTLAAQLLQDQDSLRGVVLSSAKRTFFAGADLTAVMQLRAQDASAVFERLERVKRDFRTLEALGKPVVSCLNGSALGGGWEIALLGHHRLAVDDPGVRFGLPEVTLGLLPGAGGVTKMTRHLGLMGAHPYLIEGRLFSAQQAHTLGLVHALVAPSPQAEAHMRALAVDWINAHPTAQHPWEAKDYQVPGGRPANTELAGLLSTAPALLKQRTRGLYPAPEAILACMVEGLQVDLATALRIESRYLAPLMTGANARAMINTFFFNLNRVKRGAERPGNGARFKPKRVGVLGAGLMGAGMAYVQARRGIPTVLKDVSLAKAEAGKAHCARLSAAQVSQGRMSEEQQAQLLAHIHPTEQLSDLTGCELIIETVVENRELKARVTREAEPLLAPGGLFASNTSTLPIGSLALASAAPERFVGIHFFSPVDKMKLVEVIRGPQTSEATVARAVDYARALGKLPIVVNDGPGFFTSRVFGSYVMEGVSMLGEGIPAPAIENAALQCGMPMGPLAMLDATTLTLSLHVLAQARADALAQGKNHVDSAAERLLTDMVHTHHRPGRPGGAGFYDYPAAPGAGFTLPPAVQAAILHHQPVY